ncbi:hypothetical protein HX001_16810 [Empedobacter brevis]|uniref:Uncharacterized protein n=1 Tax=Empedobacter brevis TaxID=247 RepID=A0AAJ1V9P2_9FLAO|nr:hypothetical protein [Empedobacter brevis]MDM1074147.1 hypothetical protein [Empedobacter brevis]QHC85830.1 hypothetical protein AS589_14075 [Empedobacter brevis]
MINPCRIPCQKSPPAIVEEIPPVIPPEATVRASEKASEFIFNPSIPDPAKEDIAPEEKPLKKF